MPPAAAAAPPALTAYPSAADSQIERSDDHLRAVLARLIARLGYAPDEAIIAAESGLTVEKVRTGLLRLSEAHALALHPGTTIPWVVHPFSLSPSSCWVAAECGHGYWANCLYCAFGIAAALRCDAIVSTRYGGEADPVRYTITGGQAPASDDLFHLSTPPRRWWENVTFTCSTFQPFRNLDEVHAWTERHRLPFGAVMTMPELWAFASEWYGAHLDEHWRRRTRRSAADLFERHQLTGPFWSLDD